MSLATIMEVFELVFRVWRVSSLIKGVQAVVVVYAPKPGGSIQNQ